MALPTNRQPGDVISSSDINAIATQVNTNTTAVAGKLSTSGGTMSGALNMGSKKITNLATPTNNADAATKAYVDGIKPSYYTKSNQTSVSTNNTIIYTNNQTCPVMVVFQMSASFETGSTFGAFGISTPHNTTLATSFCIDDLFPMATATTILMPGESVRSYLYSMEDASYYFEIYKFGA